MIIYGVIIQRYVMQVEIVPAAAVLSMHHKDNLCSIPTRKTTLFYYCLSIYFIFSSEILLQSDNKIDLCLSKLYIYQKYLIQLLKIDWLKIYKM